MRLMQEQEQKKMLKGVRLLGALHGLELFGHERGNIEVFKALRAMGAEIRVAVIARQEGGAVAAHLKELGFVTFPVPFRPQWSWQWLKKEGPMYGLRHLMAVWTCSQAFSRQIREFRPTHIHLGSALAYSFLSLALFRSRIPVVWRMGDCPPIDSPFNLLIWKAGMRRANHVIANSEYVRRCAIEAGIKAERISVIYNRAPNSGASSEVQPPERMPDEKVLIYVGSIAEHKGLLPLIEAFGIVARKVDGLKLWLLGGSQWDCEFRERLKSKVRDLDIENRVWFAGQVKEPAVWYPMATFHVCPSLWEEPSANVVMEAKRSGIPSVVFPSGGLPEMVRHLEDGYVCEEKSVKALAAAIQWILAEPARAAVMGAAAREDCLGRFGCERFQREWAAVYIRLRQ